MEVQVVVLLVLLGVGKVEAVRDDSEQKTPKTVCPAPQGSPLLAPKLR